LPAFRILVNELARAEFFLHIHGHLSLCSRALVEANREKEEKASFSLPMTSAGQMGTVKVDLVVKVKWDLKILIM
jgi:hypothetical protein